MNKMNWIKLNIIRKIVLEKRIDFQEKYPIALTQTDDCISIHPEKAHHNSVFLKNTSSTLSDHLLPSYMICHYYCCYQRN